MNAADRPSVTDDARAEAVREAARAYVNKRHPPVWDQGVGIVQGSHYRSGFVAGAEWAAGRAETTTATDEDTQFLATLVRLHHRLIDQMTEALGLAPDRDDDCVPECQDGPGGSEHLLWHLIQRATARTRPTETTDAQVLAALNAMHPKAAAPSLDYWGAEADKMRTALRAAWTEAGQ